MPTVSTNPELGTQVVTTTNLSDWAAPYITDMLGKTQALTDLEYNPYEGQLVAGPSAIQQSVFSGIGGLTVPSGISQALNAATSLIGQGVSYAPSTYTSPYQQVSYSPTTFANTFQAPGAYTPTQFTNQFVAPEISDATQFYNTFVAPKEYQTSQYTPEKYSQETLRPYINPYVEAVITPQQREAIRQAEIARMQNAARLAQAGAYGGSRQALMESESQRNLQTLLSDIAGKGYATAFDVAQQQFGAEQARQLEAEKQRELSRQFGAKYGLDIAGESAKYGLESLRQQELARQANLDKRLAAAELTAKYGLDTQKAQELANQFGYGKQIDIADLAAKYGMEALRESEKSRQFGADVNVRSAGDAARYALEAMGLTEKSKATAADVAAKSIAAQAAAAQAAGSIAAQEAAAQRSILETQLAAGAQQRAIEQAQLTANYDQFLKEQAYPKDMLSFMKDMISGIPGLTTTTVGTESTTPLSEIVKGAQDMAGLAKILGVTEQTLKDLFGGATGTTTTTE